MSAQEIVKAAPIPRTLAGPPSRAEWENIRDQAEILASSDFIPAWFRGKAGDIIVAFLMARELGIGPIQALNEIKVIDGAPSMSAVLMRSLVREKGHSIRIESVDREQAVVWGKRRDTGDEQHVTFTIQQAAKAGLCQIMDDGSVKARSAKGKPLPWETYTEDMLIARATSRLCRRLFEDVLLGYAYTAEEAREPVESIEVTPERALPHRPEGPLPGVHPDWIELLLTRHDESEIISEAQTFITTDRKLKSLHDLHDMPLEVRFEVANALKKQREAAAGDTEEEETKGRCATHETYDESCADCRFFGKPSGAERSEDETGEPTKAPAGETAATASSGEPQAASSDEGGAASPSSSDEADPVKTAERARKKSRKKRDGVGAEQESLEGSKT